MNKRLPIIALIFSYSFIFASENNFLVNDQNQSLLSQYSTLIASANSTRKKVSCSKNDYQTATKCLTVKVNCPEGELECKNVNLIITDKATGKQQKFNGKTWVNKVNMNFNGYDFPTPKGYYSMDLRSGNTFTLWNKKQDKILSEEEITSFPE